MSQQLNGCKDIQANRLVEEGSLLSSMRAILGTKERYVIVIVPLNNYNALQMIHQVCTNNLLMLNSVLL